MGIDAFDEDTAIDLAVALILRRRRRQRRLYARTCRPLLEWLRNEQLLWDTTGLQLETLHQLCAWMRLNVPKLFSLPFGVQYSPIPGFSWGIEKVLILIACPTR